MQSVPHRAISQEPVADVADQHCSADWKLWRGDQHASDCSEAPLRLPANLSQISIEPVHSLLHLEPLQREMSDVE